jgi:hypothetical protein
LLTTEKSPYPQLSSSPVRILYVLGSQNFQDPQVSSREVDLGVAHLGLNISCSGAIVCACRLSSAHFSPPPCLPFWPHLAVNRRGFSPSLVPSIPSLTGREEDVNSRRTLSSPSRTCSKPKRRGVEKAVLAGWIG